MKPPRKPALRHDAPANASARPSRIISRAPDDRTLRYGLTRYWWQDPYHRALTVPWWGFMLLAAGVYIGANVVFAGLYLLQTGSVAGVAPGDFADAFFFSVQTMATIGYGLLIPQTVYANILVTIEALLGLLMIAMTTGLVFARFSRPTARLLFSRNAVVGQYDGQPTLFVRIGNARRNQILQAEVAMTLVRDERTREGMTMRRFYDLKLARSRTPVFALTFLVMHSLDQDSPLRDATPESMIACDAELLLTVSGLDETMSQTIHARASYLPDEVLWGHRFADILGYTEDGHRAIDFSRFHETEKVTDRKP